MHECYKRTRVGESVGFEIFAIKGLGMFVGQSLTVSEDTDLKFWRILGK